MSAIKKLVAASAVVGGTLGVLALYNKATESMAGELDTVLTGEERRYPWKYGDMFYEVKGKRDAKPLLLVHGFGPGASSYEWRKNIDVLAENFRVFALDLLGYGLSDRPTADYSAETFADLINDFIKEVIGKSAVVVAHGQTCAYVIADAYRRPQLFEHLILVSPPTTMLQESFPGPVNAAWKSVLRTPVVGSFLSNVLTSRHGIRSYYDAQGYHNPGMVTDELVEYIYTSAHQSNSHYPLASYLSNTLNMDVHEPLARLQVPVLAVWGREGLLTPSEASSAFKRVNPRIEVRILDKASYHVQEEQAAKFNDLVRETITAAV